MVLTIGHSTRSIESFLAILQAHGVHRVVDVRTVPRSRTNPQFNSGTLEASLRDAGIGYSHLKALGGLRKPRPDSVNTAWRNTSFRGYADHMQTPEFASALQSLIDASQQEQIVIMCAEAVPWRCHRSLIGDALLARGIPVEDIMNETRRKPHDLTPFARVEGAAVTYPGEPPVT